MIFICNNTSIESKPPNTVMMRKRENIVPQKWQARKIRYLGKKALSDDYLEELNSLIKERWEEIWQAAVDRYEKDLGNSKKRLHYN